MKIVDQHSVNWQNRAHFFGIAAQMMRRILVNHAIARKTDKRGGEIEKIMLDDTINLAD